MKKSVLWAALAACFVVGACASVDITKTAEGFYNPTNANDIEILKTKPDRPYEELGTFTLTGFDSSQTAVMYNAIRAKSATLGANAAIITSEGLNPTGWGNYMRWATGVAIRYKVAK